MIHKESVGKNYSIEKMFYARNRTIQAIEHISEKIKPGMLESEAMVLSKQVLDEIGMDRLWHPTLIRFGANTLKTFQQQSEGNPVLGEDDIFFIDIGVVWDGHEGDAGVTFTTGADPEMRACADAAKTLFNIVYDHWKTQRVTGSTLYRFADEKAREMGWVLNLDIKGHRVCDFPHAIYNAGDLGDFLDYPNAGLWILEIQIAHPNRPFGAFYEDILGSVFLSS
jgi:Xaa-Pro aminopeptidase